MADVEKVSAEEVKAQLTAKKEELAAKRAELDAWLKKHDFKKGTDYSKDEKWGTKWTKLTKEVELIQAECDELRKKAPKSKEKKETAPRETKYNYPANATGDDKKKFRTSMRQKAKMAGVDVDTYLANPEKYAKAIAAKESEKSEKRKAQGEKLAAAAKAKKAAAEGGDAAPVKKAKADVAEKVVSKPKKKAVVEEED